MNDTISATVVMWVFGGVFAWLATLTLWMDRMRSSNIKNQVAIDLFVNTLAGMLASVCEHNLIERYGRTKENV